MLNRLERKVREKTRYYLITGLDCGQPIYPYIINTDNDDLDFHLQVYGDSARYYRELTAKEAEIINQEIIEEWS